jgi:hypothetical protein
VAKRVVLHMGTEKTGSTSIQRTIARNAGVLDEHGWVFPSLRQRANADPNSARSSMKSRMKWKNLDEPGWDLLDSALAKLEDGQTMVISDEGMYRTTLGLPAEKLAGMLAGCEVKVILYVREQANFLQSLILQNQKKEKRATNFEDPAYVEKLIQSRDLNYYRVCSRLEKIFGLGSVEARLSERNSLIDGDVVLDFFTTAGYEHADELVVPPTSNASLSVQMAHALRVVAQEKHKGFRYVDLRDAALRLSYNGAGDKHFMSQAEVTVLRARHAQSNQRLVRSYLTNADEVPESPAWCDESTITVQEAQDQLRELVSFGPCLGQGWGGGRNIGLRLFGEGWQHDINDRTLKASLGSQEGIIRVRVPFEQRFKRLDKLAITLNIADDDQTIRRCDVSVNERPIGEVDILRDPVVFDCDLLEPLDTAELRVRPHPDDFQQPVWIESIDIAHID